MKNKLYYTNTHQITVLASSAYEHFRIIKKTSGEFCVRTFKKFNALKPRLLSNKISKISETTGYTTERNGCLRLKCEPVQKASKPIFILCITKGDTGQTRQPCHGNFMASWNAQVVSEYTEAIYCHQHEWHKIQQQFVYKILTPTRMP